jgi:hypothetical protein
MKKILNVKNDYDSGNSFEFYKEDLLNLFNELDVYVENTNTDFYSVFKNKNNKDSYKNKITVECKGYSQSDWDRYVIYYNAINDNIKLLAKELKKLFTHKNDYVIKEIEMLNSGHSKIIEHHYFSIMNVEFPEKEDIENAIQDQLNLNYDELIINQ